MAAIMTPVKGRELDELVSAANIQLPEIITPNDQARIDGYLIAVNKLKDMMLDIWKFQPGWMPPITFGE